MFATIAVMTAFLVGCGPDQSEGSRALNPAADVDRSIKSFRLSDTKGLDSVLQYTAFNDIYRGLEPRETGADKGSAQAVRQHLDAFLGAERADGDAQYISVRNPLDLLNDVIRRGVVDNFNAGRRLMRDSIVKDEPARYNTPINDALIRFTEAESAKSTPIEDRTWVYVMLDWTYNAEMNKVFRATQFVAQSPDPQSEPPPEVASAAWSGRYSAEAFGSAGFNQPEFSATSFTGRTMGNVELLQEFVGTQRDTLTLTNASGITINGTEPDCVRVALNYSESQARIFLSSGEPATLEQSGTRKPNPRHCGNQQNGDEAVKYLTVTITGRQ